MSSAKLPDLAREYHIISVLSYRSLLSIGKLCDAGCESNFDQHTIDVTKYDKIVLQGKNYGITGLWIVPLQILDRPTHQSNNIHQFNGKENSIKYLCAAAFSPVQDTWAKVVFTYGLDSRQKTSTICLSLRPQ